MRNWNCGIYEQTDNSKFYAVMIRDKYPKNGKTSHNKTLVWMHTFRLKCFGLKATGIESEAN